MTEIVGLFGLQTVVVQVTLIIAEKCARLVDKYSQRMMGQVCTHFCVVILTIIIAIVGYIFICAIIPVSIAITDPMNTKRIDEALFQQLLPTQIAYLSMMLGIFLMPLTDKDEKSTEETRNTREHDEEPVELEEDTPV